MAGVVVVGAVALAVCASEGGRRDRRRRRQLLAYPQGVMPQEQVMVYSQPQQMPVVYAQSQQMPMVAAPRTAELRGLAPVLGVASVRLPASGTQNRSGTTWFTVEVYPDNGGPAWSVLRRYSQFRDMRKKMGCMAARLPNAAFPRRGVIGCERSKQKRLRALEQWLASTIQHAHRYTAWRTPLRVFLGEAPRAAPVLLQNYAVPLATPAPLLNYAVPSSAPAVTAPGLQARPASVPLTPPVESTMTMEIEVPAGVSAGQLIGVEVPSGQQLMLTVPNGVMGGQLLRLRYDPVAQSIQPLL